MPTIPPAVTPPPALIPQRGDRTTFSVRMDAFITWFVAVIAQLVALVTNCYNNAVIAYDSAASSAASAANAAASANVTVWVSGTNYSAGDCRWSPIDFLTYRRKTNGAGATDPSADAANWGLLFSGYAPLGHIDSLLFYKLDPTTPAFIKTAAGTISVKAGTSAMVFGTMLKWLVDTAITMPALAVGTDYAIYICTDGTIRADASFTAPAGYTVINSRLIGGFHYGLIVPGTTVAGGAFATAGSGMIWTQGDVDNLTGINKFSIWDLKFRSASNDPLFRGQKGFAYDPYKGFWLAIYEASTDTDTNGLSKYNTNIASGTVVPKVPVAYGGNGVATYAAPTSWDFAEIAAAYGGRFVTHDEFCSAAFGVTENQSIGGAASTYPTTLRNPGYTSRIGIEQASGHHWIWGADLAGASSTVWVSNGGRGQSHADTIRRVILGGPRDGAAASGSRCSAWGNSPGNVNWGVGLRAACDHLQLA